MLLSSTTFMFTSTCDAAKQLYTNNACCGATGETAVCGAPSIAADIEEIASKLQTPMAKGIPKKYNVLWMLIDDVSTERFPESGNSALEGKLPGLEELKNDGAVYHPHLYSPSSMCAPAQAALFSGMDPGVFGGHNQFTGDVIPGLNKYKTVPKPEVKFMPEFLREQGYWSTAAGKLDYQVADVIPTFYNEINGGFMSDTTSPSILDRIADPAVNQSRPFFGMLNLMDTHQLLSSLSRPLPISLTDPDSASGVPALPFGPLGYTRPAAIEFKPTPAAPVIFSPPFAAGAFKVEDVEIVGYRGALDETTLSHENGGLPAYLPDDIGMKSIIAKEYDLMRNADYRIQTTIKRLKDLGVYDDTLIMVFGDHGSGTYKAKILMELQSMHTPMWIKYPKEMQLSASVTKDSKDHNVDNRLTQLTDLLPTTLSVIGMQAPDYVTGRALAGMYESTAPERKIVFSTMARLASVTRKTHVAITKDFVYQFNAISDQSVEEYENRPDVTPELAASFEGDGLYKTSFSFFPVAPLYNYLRRLVRLNGDDPEYLQRYGYIAAEGALPPHESLYDRRTDPIAQHNLLYSREYTVIHTDIADQWGGTVEKVTVAHIENPVPLTTDQRIAWRSMKKELKGWVDGQSYVEWDFVDKSNRNAEENLMASTFWPLGIQPATANPTITVLADGSVEMESQTDGALIRYSVCTSERCSKCEQLGVDVKADNSLLSLDSPGFEAESYTLKSTGAVQTGYVYSADKKRTIAWTYFIGREKDCTLFVRSDMEFMELACPTNGNVFVFDTRDATWDGTSWVGVDSTTGGWTIPAIKLWNPATGVVNPDAFAEYIFGGDRAVIYGSTGGPKPSMSAMNQPGVPPPKYWGMPGFDVSKTPYSPTGAYGVKPTLFSYGWGASMSFDKNDKNGMDTKGSIHMLLKTRTEAPSRYDTISVDFNSFDYDECLLWGVGAVTKAYPGQHVYAQAVRKGFKDSHIVTTVA